MKRLTVIFAISMTAAAVWPARAQAAEGMVAAAAAATLPAGTSLAGLSLSGLQFGGGVLTGDDDTASGAFHAVLVGRTLLGRPRQVTVDGRVDAGFLVAGSASFSGTATVDLGGGAPPLAGVPFAVSVSPDSIQLTVLETPLPAASLSAGAIAIE